MPATTVRISGRTYGGVDDHGRFWFTRAGRMIVRRASESARAEIMGRQERGDLVRFAGAGRGRLTARQAVHLLQSATLAADGTGLLWPAHAAEARELSWALFQETMGRGCRAADKLMIAIAQWGSQRGGPCWEYHDAEQSNATTSTRGG